MVGFELVEVLPYRVPDYETMLNCACIVRECLVGIAMRKMGITYKQFLHPRTASRSGQDSDQFSPPLLEERDIFSGLDEVAEFNYRCVRILLGLEAAL